MKRWMALAGIGVAVWFAATGIAWAKGGGCSGHGISPGHAIEAAEPIRVTVTVDGEELTTKADNPRGRKIR